jgi:hypothetical protein
MPENLAGTIVFGDVHHHGVSLPSWPAQRDDASIGLAPFPIEPATMHRHDEAYRITYITLDEVQLHFETEIAVTDEDGSLALLRAATPPAERRALRELICEQDRAVLSA